MHIKTSLVVFLLFNIAVNCYASVNEVHEYKLNNGMHVFVKEDHRAPVAVTQIWYKVGSSYEPTGITGISHVLEHMMFKGTKKFPKQSFSEIIGENGGRLNASTSRDVTFYYEELAADKLPLALELEADRMTHLTLRQADFEKELEVVKEERRLRTDNNPQGRTYERFMAAAFVSSPYHHPVVGWMSDLNQLTLKEVKHWYKKWYAPNNAILVVVGDVNADEVYRQAKKYFSHIKPSKLPRLKQITEEKGLGKRSIDISIPAQVPWLIMGYQTPSLTTAKQKWEPYALALLSAILDLGGSARLSKNIIRGKQIASSAGAGYDPFTRISNLFELSATPAPNKTLDQVQHALLHEIEQLKTTPVSDKELQRARAQLLADKIYARDSIATQAEQIGYTESIGLSWREYNDFLQQIQKITPEQILSVARTYLTEERLTVATLTPQTGSLHTEQEKKG